MEFSQLRDFSQSGVLLSQAEHFMGWDHVTVEV